MRLVGLTGFAGSGKDAVASILAHEHGFHRVAFADPMREILYALDPIVDWDCGCDVPGGGLEPRAIRVRELVSNLGWDQAKRMYPEIRTLLQRLGTEGGRDVYGEDHWVDQGMKTAYRLRGAVVFSDVRFENEARAIRLQGGEIWRIVRPGVGPIGTGHASDSEVYADRTILNDGTLSDLGYAVFGAITERAAA